MSKTSQQKLSIILSKSMPAKRNSYALILHIIMNSWKFLHSNNQYTQISQLSIDGKDLILYVSTSPSKILRVRSYIHKLKPIVDNLIFPYKIHSIFLFSRALSYKKNI